MQGKAEGCGAALVKTPKFAHHSLLITPKQEKAASKLPITSDISKSTYILPINLSQVRY